MWNTRKCKVRQIFCQNSRWGFGFRKNTKTAGVRYFSAYHMSLTRPACWTRGKYLLEALSLSPCLVCFALSSLPFLARNQPLYPSLTVSLFALCYFYEASVSCAIKSIHVQLFPTPLKGWCPRELCQAVDGAQRYQETMVFKRRNQAWTESMHFKSAENLKW